MHQFIYRRLYAYCPMFPIDKIIMKILFNICIVILSQKNILQYVTFV